MAGGLRTAQSAYNDAQWMQRCSATEQGSNAGFEKCMLYGVRHPCRCVLIKAVHAFLHTACMQLANASQLFSSACHCDHATDATHPGVQARALGRRESNLKCRRASTARSVLVHGPGGKIITATHTRKNKLWKLSPTVHLRHFEFQDPRSPLPALSVQRAADVPLSCLVCVGMTAPYPCYVLISDRTDV